MAKQVRIELSTNLTYSTCQTSEGRCIILSRIHLKVIQLPITPVTYTLKLRGVWTEDVLTNSVQEDHIFASMQITLVEGMTSTTNSIYLLANNARMPTNKVTTLTLHSEEGIQVLFLSISLVCASKQYQGHIYRMFSARNSVNKRRRTNTSTETPVIEDNSEDSILYVEDSISEYIPPDPIEQAISATRLKIEMELFDGEHEATVCRDQYAIAMRCYREELESQYTVVSDCLANGSVISKSTPLLRTLPRPVIQVLDDFFPHCDCGNICAIGDACFICFYADRVNKLHEKKAQYDKRAISAIQRINSDIQLKFEGVLKQYSTVPSA